MKPTLMRVIRPAQTQVLTTVTYKQVLQVVWSGALLYFLVFRIILLATAIWLDPAISERFRPFMALLVGIDAVLFPPMYSISYQVFADLIPQPMAAEMLGSIVMIVLAAAILAIYAFLIYLAVVMFRNWAPRLNEALQNLLHHEEL